jgi:hypothetical protein
MASHGLWIMRLPHVRLGFTRADNTSLLAVEHLGIDP